MELSTGVGEGISFSFRSLRIGLMSILDTKTLKDFTCVPTWPCSSKSYTSRLATCEWIIQSVPHTHTHTHTVGPIFHPHTKLSVSQSLKWNMIYVTTNTLIQTLLIAHDSPRAGLTVCPEKGQCPWARGYMEHHLEVQTCRVLYAWDHFMAAGTLGHYRERFESHVWDATVDYL